MSFVKTFTTICSKIYFMTIGERIKELREQKKWSQDELATKLGITQDSISLWEKNRRIPNTQYIISLSELFGISCDYILGYENEEGIKRFSFPQTPQLTIDEQKLLKVYRAMSPGKKKALFDMLDITSDKISKENT